MGILTFLQTTLIDYKTIGRRNRKYETVTMIIMLLIALEPSPEQ